jgi:hypothetical protein
MNVNDPRENGNTIIDYSTRLSKNILKKSTTVNILVFMF